MEYLIYGVLFLIQVAIVAAVIGTWVNSAAIRQDAKSTKELLEICQGYLKQIAAQGRNAPAKTGEKPAQNS